MLDSDQIRSAQLTAAAARHVADCIIESIDIPLLMLGSDLHVRRANRAFYEHYRAQPSEVEGHAFHYMRTGEWNAPGLADALERMFSESTQRVDLEFDRTFAGLGKRSISLRASLVEPDGESQILIAAEDITARKRAGRMSLQDQERLPPSEQHSTQILDETAESLPNQALAREQAITSLYESKEALLRSREALRALTANLFNTQDEERRRVSREVHDNLTQKTAKLEFDLETLEQQLPPNLGVVKRQLQAARDRVAALSDDLRRVAEDLHPSTLDNLGLSVTLRSLIREFPNREDLHLHVTTRNVPKRIPIAIASSLFRVVQESLRSFAKEAGKASVRITLVGKPNELSLAIRHDGAGFDPRSTRERGDLVLISMQERVRVIHGDFCIEPRPPHGVVIKVRVPL